MNTLYRAMLPAEDGAPMVGDSRNQLGVRPSDVKGANAGPGQGGTSFRLRQSIATESWNLLIDNEGLWFRVRAQTRALFAGDDPHEVWLRFFDARNVLISESGSPPYQGVGWNGVELLAAAPVGTRFVHVQLRCEREFGDNCSGYFDDVSLVASYP